MPDELSQRHDSDPRVSSPRGAQRREAEDGPQGLLAIDVVPVTQADAQGLRARVRHLTLDGPAGPVRREVLGRTVELDPRGEDRLELALPVPAGEYGAVVLGLGAVEVRRGDDEPWEPVLDSRDVELPLDLRIGEGGRAARLVLEVDAEALAQGGDPQDLVQARWIKPEEAVAFEVAKGRPVDARLPLSPRVGDGPGPLGIEAVYASVSLAPDVLPPGSGLVLRDVGGPGDAGGHGDGLPELFAGQRRVGPAVEITADAPLRGPAWVTVPYNPELLAASGHSLDSVIVMHLSAGRDHYRELRPHRVDAEARTLTARVGAFSTFFACTPGIEVHAPELRRDALGRIRGFTGRGVATVAGRTPDPRAQVALRRPAGAPGGWNRHGWFNFEDVPMAPGETPVELEAAVDGLVEHSCELVLHGEPPPERITRGSRGHGPVLAEVAGVPTASAVIPQGRIFQNDLFDGLASWQRGFVRPGAYVYRPTDDQRGWRWSQLLADSHFEEQAARFAVRLLAPEIEVPIDAGAPAGVRTLASLAAFVGGRPEDDGLRLAAFEALALGADTFSAEGFPLSPRVALAPLGDGFAAAFVAADLEGSDAAAGSALGPILHQLYFPLAVRPASPRVRGGRLWFVSGQVGGALRREPVADGIWCASVALGVDPVTGQPRILALGIHDDAAGDDGEVLPRSRLLLFRRRNDGSWGEEALLEDRPVVDGDLAIDAAGRVRVVASVAASDAAVKAHLVSLREDRGFRAEPIAYTSGGDEPRTLDRGLWPRIVIDGRGRSVVTFTQFLSTLQWMTAVDDGSGWRVTALRRARYEDLTGSPLPPPSGGGQGFLRIDAPVSASGLSLAHWASDLTLGEPGEVWCVYGNGVLNLARIEVDSLFAGAPRVDDGAVRVDRATGFFPSVAMGASGAPMVAYKDPWGWGPQHGFHDLLFLDLAQGADVPGGRFGGPMPPYGQGRIRLWDFAPHVALDCPNLVNLGLVPRLLASILRHRRFDVEAFPKGGLYPERQLRYRLSHPRLASMVEGLSERPGVAVFRIDNREFPAEDVDRVDITSFLDSVATVADGFADELDQSSVSEPLAASMASVGLVIDAARARVEVLSEGWSWDVTDPRAYLVGAQFLPQTYQIRRKNDDELDVFLPPVLSIVDRAEVLDELRRPLPCGRRQEDWDQLLGPFIERFTGIRLALPDDTPGRVEWILLRGMHMTRLEPRDPAGSAQGGVRFELTIPSFFARNEEPDADIYSTEPSRIFVTVAPYLRDNRLRWWVRESEVRMGNVEADVDFGIFNWLRWLSVIPGFGFLLLAVDPIADAVATGEVSEGLRPPDTGSLQGLLAEALEGWVNDLLGPEPPRFEAAYLRDMTIRTWSRAEQTDLPARSILELTPAAGLGFPAVTLGEGAARRRILLSSVGQIPVAVESVVVTGGAPEFAVASPATWPGLLEPGDSWVLDLTFDPAVPAGLRAGELTVTYNGGRTLRLPLQSVAVEPQEPRLATAPSELLNFGVVAAGQVRRSRIEVRNDGAGQLDVAVPALEGDPAQRGAFALVAPAPAALAFGDLHRVEVEYRPALGGAPRHEATLVLNSNDPDRPRHTLRLVGTSAVGSLRLSSSVLDFGSYPLDADIPPLPPGLPPTLHRGRTRTLTLYNTGTADLTVEGASFRVFGGGGAPSPHYRLWNVDGSPRAAADLVLRAGLAASVVVEFLPQVAGDHPATLRVQSSDPAAPVLDVAITGRGAP
ncbi:MAG: choice-of-anchor D domain-containing protein [Acidobacteriota bacterium]